MPDIIDELDRLHAKATPGEWFYVASMTDEESMTAGGTYADVVVASEDDDSSPASVIDGPSDRDAELIASLRSHWPAISARLREAERSMAALAAVNTGLVGIGRNGTNYRQWCAWRQTHGGTDGPTAISEDLLTAIESALAAKETP